MNILIETCLNDLYLLLFNENKVIDKIIIKDLKKKSEKLPSFFNNILARNNLNVKNIERFYVTKGPGSFMGVRAGLLFIQTLAGILDKKVYSCSTLKFLQTNKIKNVYIDARGDTFYSLINDKYGFKKGDFRSTKTNYDFIENNIKMVISNFNEIDPFKNNALYIKKPRIG